MNGLSPLFGRSLAVRVPAEAEARNDYAHLFTKMVYDNGASLVIDGDTFIARKLPDDVGVDLELEADSQGFKSYSHPSNDIKAMQLAQRLKE